MSTDSEIANLEWAVVEAAVKRRAFEKSGVNKNPPFDYAIGLQYFNAIAAETEALDALITARERAGRETTPIGSEN